MIATRELTALTLLAIAGAHVAWGRGSSFPFPNRDDLADAVAGSEVVPSPRACYAVAGALAVASGLVGGLPIGPKPLQRAGVATLVATLTIRGGVGIAGWTDVLVPGSNSPRFRRLDRRFYAPLCLALAAGSATALR